MRLTFILAIVVLFYSCTNVDALNDQIYKAQKQAVISSPYKSAKGATIYEVQKKFRADKLPKLIKSKIYSSINSNDTILIAESFDAFCINCPSNRMQVLYKDTVYSLTMEITERNKLSYKTAIDPFNIASKEFEYKLKNCGLIETLGKIRNNDPWTANPLEYGTDNCNDGSHTLVTVIYPGKKIEAIYVRCWIPFIYRNKK